MNFIIAAVNKTLQLLALLLVSVPVSAKYTEPMLNDKEYFEAPGLNILVFNNWYDGFFSDSKISGIEIIHHGKRTATNGDVRLQATPEQWDAIPEFVEKKVDTKNGIIEAFLRYPDYNFDYSIKVQRINNGIGLTVNLKRPLPQSLAGRAGFNLEFLPSAYFEKSFIMDQHTGVFPLYPGGLKEINDKVQPLPLATGKHLVLAPDDPLRRVSIMSSNAELNLFDGRNKAQNGWFVVRSLLPVEQTGAVIDWHIAANSQPGWIRSPMIAHSQVGYHPDQKKIAIIELDQSDNRNGKARLLKVTVEGNLEEKLKHKVNVWGVYARYRYVTFDFTDIRESGIYVIQYGNVKTAPFRIAADVYDTAWHPTLDIYMPVQMDHILVNEAYRVWHGASHLDDALQAPVNHEHFDLYAQGPGTNTRYKPGEHIPGLNIGGWYDAGDYDIRTQSQYSTVINLVNVWDSFAPDRDTTTVDYHRKIVDLHVADGKPDLQQQIEHGTLALLAQHRAFGRAIPGIIVPDISQYTHLGDAITMTDNLIFDSKMNEMESDGYKSGKPDDRWAFTGYSSALNYGSIAALAAASRALKGYNDRLAGESLAAAAKAWTKEQAREPGMFKYGNTTGGNLHDEMFKAATELLITTREKQYTQAVNELLPKIEKRFGQNAVQAVKVIPYMNAEYRTKLKSLTQAYKQNITETVAENPFGVPITTGGWAGNGTVINFAITNYYLHKTFPDLINRENVFNGLNFIYGNHPGSNLSFVSNVGTRSKKIAYGMNRADFSFISGGIVPGVLRIKPDFPENKEDWPFFWGQNEYVIALGARYIYLVNAVRELLTSADKNQLHK